jgi:hypothetical protein
MDKDTAPALTIVDREAYSDAVSYEALDGGELVEALLVSIGAARPKAAGAHLYLTGRTTAVLFGCCATTVDLDINS